MDPISAAGIALSVAALAGQVFGGCIQGIQFIITAKDLPEDSKYLNLRLRMEQQRLFAWSETSGLLDLENANDTKIRESRTWMLHRNTILDLLVQIKILFQEFEKAQRENKHLVVAHEAIDADNEFNEDPGKDSSSAHVPLPESRRKFIIRTMRGLKEGSKEGVKEGRRRLKWAAFSKQAFESMLQRFAALNDNMTDVLDAQLQTEIHRTTQDTNRGVLQLHKDLSSLQRLVMALDIKMQQRTYQAPIFPQFGPTGDVSGLHLLTQLAKFKAFNESMENESTNPWDEATGMILELGKPATEKASTKIDRSSIILTPSKSAAESVIRCEAVFVRKDGSKQDVWIEWKEYDYQKPGAESPPRGIVDRVQKLAALLHHSPKPEAFRVPHCLGYFDNVKRPGDSDADSEGEEDSGDPRIGFVFEKPTENGISTTAAPVSLSELLSSPKPRVTDRIRLAHAIANCLLYLHSVNWLHKGLRSHNIVFFPVPGQHKTHKVDYSKPYLSGFDFARPARADALDIHISNIEATEVPGDIPEYNMYRHPSTQGIGFGPRESFRKSFDIYSLGIVLAELAHWETIDKILGIEIGKVRLAARIRDMLLEEHRVADIGANMGEIYEHAMRKCIAGGRELRIDDKDDETNDTVAAKLSMAFYEDVVKKLGDVKV